jgi:hypothetical protein
MTARLENALKQLPPDALEEVADFAEFLASRRVGSVEATSERPPRLKLNWAGALSDLKE